MSVEIACVYNPAYEFILDPDQFLRKLGAKHFISLLNPLSKSSVTWFTVDSVKTFESLSHAEKFGHIEHGTLSQHAQKGSLDVPLLYWDGKPPINCQREHGGRTSDPELTIDLFRFSALSSYEKPLLLSLCEPHASQAHRRS